MSNLDRRQLTDAGLTASEAACVRLETRLGGRQALVEALLPAVVTKDQEYLVGVLADPRNATQPLSRLLGAARVTYATLLNLYAEAKLTAAHAEVKTAVAEQLPGVATAVMRGATTHKAVCPVCEGNGTLVRDRLPGVDESDPSPVRCVRCDGFGYVIHDPTLAGQKLALELGRVLVKTPAVAVNVSQSLQQATVFGAVASSFVDEMTRQTDDVLYGDRGRSRRVGRSRTGAAADADADVDVDADADASDTP